MGYPRLVNWVGFRNAEGGGYIIRDHLAETQYGIDPHFAWFAKQLNGKRDPYEIDPSISHEQVTEYLRCLDETDLLRTSRVLEKSILGTMVTLWIPKVTDKLRIISWFINALLMIAWFPVLVSGIYGLMECGIFDESGMLAGGILGALAGIVLHELGHMFACLGYGGRVFELGVSLSVIAPGAYTLIDEKPIKKRFRRMQMYAAGVEFNFLLAGIAGILAMKIESCESFFFVFALSNILLALSNVCFSNGIDGFRILEELLGTDNLFEQAKRVRKSKARRRHLMRKGLTGVASVAACYMLGIFRLIVPVSFIVGVIGGISWMF